MERDSARESNKHRGSNINYGEEQDELRQKYKSCDKDPVHEKFIPVEKFDVNHLSTGYRDKDIFDAIKTLSKLTVRVTVQTISGERPKTYPGTDIPYPGYGEKDGSIGSGLVCDVSKNTKSRFNPLNAFCQCNICKNLPQNEQKKYFAELCISTATHVVFDELEGEYTSCYLFFDNGNSPPTGSGVVELRGMFPVSSDIDTDLCKMTYFTHDKVLINRLEKKMNKLRDHESNIKRNYDLTFVTEPKIPSLENQPIVIVSHPHGCSKQVSVGEYKLLHEKESLIEYTAATCCGSSGAPVFFIDKLGNERPIHIATDDDKNYAWFPGDREN